MSRKFPILALALLFPIRSHAADQGTQISAHYESVERAIPRATVVKRELQGYSTEGGELTAYFQKGVPLKLTAKYYGESGKATEEYYFWQGRLFFILRTSESYDISSGDLSTRGKIVARKQERWYFKDGNLKRWIRPGGETLESGDLFKNQEKNYLALAREFLAGARGKAKVLGAV